MYLIYFDICGPKVCAINQDSRAEHLLSVLHNEYNTTIKCDNAAVDCVTFKGKTGTG